MGFINQRSHQWGAPHCRHIHRRYTIPRPPAVTHRWHRHQRRPTSTHGDQNGGRALWMDPGGRIQAEERFTEELRGLTETRSRGKNRRKMVGKWWKTMWKA